MAEDPKAKGAAGAPAKKNKMTIMLIMFGGAVLVGGGVGVLAGKIFSPSAPATAQKPAAAEEEDAAAAEEGGGGHGGGHGGGEKPKTPPPADADYVKLDTVTCNLDHPTLSRYVRVTIALVPIDKKRKEVQKALDSKKPEVQNAITSYFAGCNIESVRGEQNHNRIRRDLKDKINRVLWPGDNDPLVKEVLFTEIQFS